MSSETGDQKNTEQKAKQKNSKQKKEKFYRRKNRSYKGFVFMIISLAGIVLLFLVDEYWDKNFHGVPRSLIFAVLSNVVSVFGIGTMWEWFAKREFAQQIRKESKQADNVIDSGISDFYAKFTDIRWEEELKSVKSFKVFLTFGQTWRKNNLSYLEDITEKRQGTFEVILPNPHHKAVIDSLVLKYNNKNGKKYTAQSITDDLLKSIDDFKSIGAEVRLYDGVINSSYYVLDDRICFVSPYLHYDGRSVPALKLTEGNYFEFCLKDMEQIHDNSKRVKADGGSAEQI